MTSISQWLRIEEKDRSEPVSFYLPGETRWPRRRPEVVVMYEEWEIQEVIDLRKEDEQ